MAEDNTPDSSQKTEEPTQHRLEEARKKGQLPLSRELNHLFMLIGGALFIAFLAPSMGQDLLKNLRSFLEFPHHFPVEGPSLEKLAHHTILILIGALTLPFIFFVSMALLAGILQTGFNISAEPLKPTFDKISISKGLARIFSVSSLVDLLKSFLKIIFIGIVVVVVLKPHTKNITTYVELAMPHLLTITKELATTLIITVLCIMAFIACLDYAFQYFKYLKNLRMSKQELKEEIKQNEGDPAIRGRLRQLRQERAKRRMMAAVPQAAVVITNPTHFAVALKFNMEMDTPIVVAKGADFLAQRIREVAEQSKVPIVNNPPLARALYTLELDQEIPAEHYQAVAEIIRYVMTLKPFS